MIRRKIVRELARWRRRRLERVLPQPGPLPLGRDPIEVHTLVCARDVTMSLWSIESFVAFTGLLPRVVVRGDGTLTDEHRRLYRRHFDGITVIEDPESDRRMDEALAPWPTCRRFRRDPAFFCARKLFDPLFLARADTVVLIDSDVLFFQRPDRLLEHAAAGTPCFSSDYQNAYALPHDELERWAGRDVHPCVNSGLLAVPVEAYRARLDLVEHYLSHVPSLAPDVDVNRHEQTVHALLMSALGAERLPQDYRLVGALDDRTVSFHFLGDGCGRKRFWRQGVPRIAPKLERHRDGIARARPPRLVSPSLP